MGVLLQAEGAGGVAREAAARREHLLVHGAQAVDQSREAGCFEEISVDDDPDGVGVRLVKPRSLEHWKPVSDLSPLSEVALGPAVITELRKQEGCDPLADRAETLSVGVAPRLWLRTEIAGCTSAAMADLRAAARALVDRLAAGPAPDAGDSREPPDGRW